MLNTANLDLKTKGSTTPLDPASIPNFIPSGKNGGFNSEKFRVRYQKLDMDNPADVAELEKIETKALHNTGCFVWSKKDYVFMDRIFILVQYLEEIPLK